MNLQSVLFDKEIYTTGQARKWLEKNNIVPIKRVQKVKSEINAVTQLPFTENFYRYRIRNPKDFNRFFTKKIKYGIDFVFGKILKDN